MRYASIEFLNSKCRIAIVPSTLGILYTKQGPKQYLGGTCAVREKFVGDSCMDRLGGIKTKRITSAPPNTHFHSSSQP